MKDTYYFSHDYNARNDSKIKKLLSKHGFTGYGLFWAIIEDLYNNANALPTDYDSIAFDLRTDKKTIQDIITGFDLFVIDGDIFGSHSIEKRLEERNEKSAMARKSALKRWNKDANALPTQSDSNAIKESKRKEKKIDFSLFWSVYPRKEGKKKSAEKWNRLKIETQQKILDTLPKFLEGKDLKFVPMPETYFNKERWDDEVVVSTQSSPPVLEAKRTSLAEAQALKDSFG
jgi:uncharacterized protein YdaU (DUF1376 family)